MLQWAKYAHLNVNKPYLQLGSFVEGGRMDVRNSTEPLSSQDVIKEEEEPTSH